MAAAAALPTRQVGILVFDGFEPIDVWGYIEAFAAARYPGQAAKPQPGAVLPFCVQLITVEKRPSPTATPVPVRSFNGPRAVPDVYLDDSLNMTWDVVMVPGGFGMHERYQDPVLCDWARKISALTTIMSSVCTGAFLLAAAGLLDGRRAATNHSAFGIIAVQYGMVKWDNISRWCRDGKFWTSAGVSAGIDLSFALVEEIGGRYMSTQAALEAEYPLKPNPRRNPLPPGVVPPSTDATRAPTARSKL